MLTIPEAFQGSYYRSLDGIRGIAVLLVLLAHFGINRLTMPFHFSIDSETGVHIFFVLSGFLITTVLLKEKIKNETISLKTFYIRRILRIIPVAYLFLVVLIALNFFYQLRISVLDFSLSFLFLKNLPVKLGSPFTAHFWSLAVEEQFYISFPLLLAFNVNRYLVTALTIVIVVPLVSILGFYQVGFLYANPLIHFITQVIMYAFWKGPVMILIGSVFSLLFFKGIIKTKYAGNHYFLSFVLLLTAIALNNRTSPFYCKYTSEYIAAIIFAYTILLSINSVNFLSVMLNNRILVKIGILSYSLYIWQQLFIGARVWQPWLAPLHGYPLPLLITIKFLCIFIMAYLSYYFFESKFLRLKNKFLYHS